MFQRRKNILSFTFKLNLTDYNRIFRVHEDIRAELRLNHNKLTKDIGVRKKNIEKNFEWLHIGLIVLWPWGHSILLKC